MDALAAGLSTVVLPWLVLDAGGSRALAGSAFLLGTVPYILLGLQAGGYGDHHPRRRIMVVAAAGQAAGALVLPLVVALGPASADLPIALIFAAGMAVTAGRVFVDAAAFGAMSRLVGEAHFVEGQAALTLVWSLGFLVGPALGGAAIGIVGPVRALWVETGGFILAAALMASIASDLGPDRGEHPERPPLLSGITRVAQDRALRRLTTVSMAWNLTVNVFYALLVVYARTELHAGGPAAGRMLAVGGGAGLVGGFAAPAARARLGATRALRISLVLNAVAGVGLAAASGLTEATIAFAGLEGSGLCFITLVIGERQSRAETGEEGRIGITGRMAALLASSVGATIASVLVTRLSPSAVFAVGAAATAVVAAASMRALELDDG
jgi:predicted MFS family arabinose efflux permease